MFISVVTLLSIFLSATCSQTPSVKPNIVIVLADDLGWDDVGFHGSQQIPTPNLDALAYRGIILGNYYVQPICTPSRAALLTGRHPIHLGLQHDVLSSAQPYGLPLDEVLFPQYLQPYGYRTHLVGKWHLGFVSKEYLPTSRGFETHYGYYQGAGDYYDHTYTGAWPDDHKSWGFDFHRNGTVERSVFGQYSTELFTGEAERIIALHNASEPLFLYLAHQAVHSGNPLVPLEAPWKYIQQVPHIKSKMRRTYAAMVSALDESIGNVTRALHAKGMLQNTIIVFSTDNGGPAYGFNRNDASNSPLRGLKQSLWEGGVRGTGFIWSPLLRTSRYTSQQLLHITDWLPTLLHAAVGEDAVARDLPSHVDGVDQWNVLSDNGAPVRKEILHNIDPIEQSQAIRVGDMKLVAARHGYTRFCDGWYPTDNRTSNETLPYPCSSDVVSGSDVYANAPDQKYYVDDDDRVESDLDAASSLRTSLLWSGAQSVQYDPRARKRGDRDYGFFRTPDALPIRQMWAESADDTKSRRQTGRTQTDLTRILDKCTTDGSAPRAAVGSPLVVDCGTQPTNASTNCRPWQAPCLYNVTADPCEYYNLAAVRPDIVKLLSDRLLEYRRSAKRPLNKPVDDAGLPYHHNWTWVPWIKA